MKLWTGRSIMKCLNATKEISRIISVWTMSNSSFWGCARRVTTCAFRSLIKLLEAHLHSTAIPCRWGIARRLEMHLRLTRQSNDYCSKTVDLTTRNSAWFLRLVLIWQILRVSRTIQTTLTSTASLKLRQYLKRNYHYIWTSWGSSILTSQARFPKNLCKSWE